MKTIEYKKIKEKVYKLSNPTGAYKNLFFREYELPNGSIESFFIDKAKDSVQIFCLTKEQDVVLVNQYRTGPERMCLELPGGGIEEGEEPLEAGIRELLEETGYEGSASYYGSLPYSPYSTGNRHCIIVLNGEKVKKISLDPNEFLQVVLMPFKLFRSKLSTGEIRGFDFAYQALEYIGKL